MRDGMMQRNMADTLRQAHAALLEGAFGTARALSAPLATQPAGALIHTLARAGAGEDAAAALAAIARANPHARHPVLDLVDLLRRLGRNPDAIAHLRAAVHHRPDDPALLDHLGAALAEAGPIEDAIEAFRRAAALRPDHAPAWSNLGKALAAAGRLHDAEPAFARAASLAPSEARIMLNHAVACLKSGRLAQAWSPFRARHRLPGRRPALPGPELASPDAVAGQAILLLHDEGYGDTLQFIRYATLLQRRGARVAIAAPPALERLLAGNGFDVAPGRYDAWCRIADLPGVFGTTMQTIPAEGPYLRPDPALVAHWAQRLPPASRPPTTPGPRLGLVWAGAARLHDADAAATDRARSIPHAALAPLLATPGVTWVSLQHGRPAPPGVADPMPGVTDFADTAAIVASLDAVFSVDTAVAHLAAAQGVPVVLLDRFDNCWRWFAGRTDSPWYPGVLHIVRQPAPGDWGTVLREAAAYAASTMIR